MAVSSYERLKKFLKRNPHYMSRRLAITRAENPNYYSKRTIAQRARRRAEREAVSA
jgi:hypothetical protein